MKKSKWSVEKIVSILKENESGVSASELCRKYGMSDATFYNWRKKYSGMTVSDAHRLKELESENARLKRIVGNKELEIDALKDVLSKNW
ncbi:MAG: transposase [Candidatus Sabulitectum sp.]|nr:transposase [Candidatus Sabulitectum sp.]